MNQTYYINYLIAINYLSRLLESDITESLKKVIKEFIEFMQMGVNKFEIRPNNKKILEFDVNNVTPDDALKTTFRVVKTEAYICNNEIEKERLSELAKYLRHLYILNRMNRKKEGRELWKI